MNLGDFTNKASYTQIRNVLTTHAPTLDINGVRVPVQDGVRAAKEMFPAALGVENKNIAIQDYYAPSKIALDTFYKLGTDMDNSIQSAFLLQTFNLKGTDILCSMFCFTLSLMSCSARNSLYNAVHNFNTVAKVANQTTNGINEIIDSVNVFTGSARDMAQAVGEVFNTPMLPKLTQSIGSAAAATSTAIAIPMSILNVIDKVSKAIKFAMNFKFSIPDFTGKAIWDLAQNVLYALQGILLHAADSILSKVLAPIVDLINSMMPAECFNTMADRVRVSILQTMNSLKSRILSEIADLFASNADFNQKFRKTNKRLAWSLELAAFTQALDHITSNFFAMANGCGLTPCSENKNTGTGRNGSDIPYTLTGNSTIGEIDLSKDTINPFTTTPVTPPVYKTQYLDREISVTLDDIATRFEEFLSPDTLVITENNITSTYNILTNAPVQIRNFVRNGTLNNVLDSNYNIDIENENKAVVTYSYNRKCGGYS
jgi:hypothetical protein